MNTRPIDRLDKYLSHKKINRSNAEKTLGIANGYIRNQLTKQGSIGSEILEKVILEFLDLDIIWLITGKGEMIVKPSPTLSPTLSPSAPTVLKEDEKEKEPTLLIAAETPSKYGAGTKAKFEAPKVVTIDSKGRDNCVMVPIGARAGYLTGYGDMEFIQELPLMNIPQLKHGTYRAFEVLGLSMYDTLNDGDVIVCKYATSNDFINGRVYVLVTKTDGILVKRCSFHATGILCNSDNNLSGEYPPITIQFADIAEIWSGYLKMSYQLAAPGLLQKRMTVMEYSMSLMQEQLNKLSTKI